MIEIPLTLLSARLSPICKITKEKGKQFTITYYKKEVGYIIPVGVATAWHQKDRRRVANTIQKHGKDLATERN